jgi:transposase
MLTLPPSVRIYVATAPCDMRKQFDGISLVVEQQLQLDPRSGHLFVVFNKRGDHVRILFWDRHGYCMLANQPSSHYTSFDL